MMRPKTPECLPQKTLLQLWRGPGGVWERAVEQHPCGIEWVRPLRGSSHRSLQETQNSPLSRKDKVSASMVPCEYPVANRETVSCLRSDLGPPFTCMCTSRCAHCTCCT